MQKGNWKVHKVIFDNYRMQNAYVAANFTKSFFSALKDMARKDILCDADESVHNHGRIYLPFNAHSFYFIHAYKFNKDFYISYLVNDDINWFNNTLHYATENNLFKDLVKIHKIELETDHISNVRCTKKEILDQIPSICAVHSKRPDRTRNMSIYNMICWFAGPTGQMTHQPSVWCSNFFIKSCKILCKNPFNLLFYFFEKLQKWK